MDRFVARENIRHLRERLWVESDPDLRSRLRTYLVEEEDKLGAGYELLADLERHIANGDWRIEKQRELVVEMERNGHDGLDRAKLLLGLFMEVQSLHESYRDQVRIRIERNGL